VLNPAVPSKWTGITYEQGGVLAGITAVGGSGILSRTTWALNADGRVDAEHRFTAGTAFDTWNLLFDWLGHQRQVTDGQAMVTRSVRDDFGRIVKLESPDLGGFPTLRIHDAGGRVEMVKEVFGGRAGDRTVLRCATRWYDLSRRFWLHAAGRPVSLYQDLSHVLGWLRGRIARSGDILLL
jgi:hypothetical protein